MYAVVKASGRQLKVTPGAILEVNRMQGAPGDKIVLEDSVLMVNDDSGLKIGTPIIAGASVELEILEHFRGKKVIVFKMKRRKRYRRKNGHRQELTRVSVSDIKLS